MVIPVLPYEYIIVAHAIFNFRVQDLLSSVFPTFLPK